MPNRRNWIIKLAKRRLHDKWNANQDEKVGWAMMVSQACCEQADRHQKVFYTVVGFLDCRLGNIHDEVTFINSPVTDTRDWKCRRDRDASTPIRWIITCISSDTTWNGIQYSDQDSWRPNYPSFLNAQVRILSTWYSCRYSQITFSCSESLMPIDILIATPDVLASWHHSEEKSASKSGLDVSSLKKKREAFTHQRKTS